VLLITIPAIYLFEKHTRQLFDKTIFSKFQTPEFKLMLLGLIVIGLGLLSKSFEFAIRFYQNKNKTITIDLCKSNKRLYAKISLIEKINGIEYYKLPEKNPQDHNQRCFYIPFGSNDIYVKNKNSELELKQNYRLLFNVEMSNATMRIDDIDQNETLKQNILQYRGFKKSTQTKIRCSDIETDKYNNINDLSEINQSEFSARWHLDGVEYDGFFDKYKFGNLLPFDLYTLQYIQNFRIVDSSNSEFQTPITVCELHEKPYENLVYIDDNGIKYDMDKTPREGETIRTEIRLYDKIKKSERIITTQKPQTLLEGRGKFSTELLLKTLYETFNPLHTI
jgi:hypothetical protein